MERNMRQESVGTAVSTLIGVVLLLALIFLFVPFMTIWSLNVLFHLNIPFALDTWFAASWLGGLVGNSVFRRTKD
jgi:hypothetical protein